MALSTRPVTPHPYHRRPCQVGRWAATLPPEEHQALKAALLDPAHNAASIARWVNTDPDYDVNFGADAIRYHRNGLLGRENGCSCGAGE